MLGKPGAFNEESIPVSDNNGCKDANASCLILKMDFDSLIALRSNLKKLCVCCREADVEACEKAGQFIPGLKGEK